MPYLMNTLLKLCCRTHFLEFYSNWFGIYLNPLDEMMNDALNNTGTKEYKSAEEVRADYENGVISKEQAKQIIEEKGFKY